MELKTTELAEERNGLRYRVVGTMSGTSMDALDVVEAAFWVEHGHWHSEILRLHEVELCEDWPERFRNLEKASARTWMECERDWSAWCAAQLLEHASLAETDLVVFSGQTIFHQPEAGYTAQLGSGADLHGALGAHIPVVSDLRSLDVALGGQGAPLVPVADAMLFPEYEACLNLGGFSNISSDRNGLRTAWDIGPCNLVLNALAQRRGQACDFGGELARKGKVKTALLEAWLSLDYHAQPAPKSLGTEWLHTAFWPRLTDFESHQKCAVEDLLATASTYIAASIRKDARGARTLVTGGGAFNEELLRLLRQEAPLVQGDRPIDAVVPAPELIKGKEALAFGFLGLLRWLEVPNSWPSVTGCHQAHLGGALWGKNGVSSPPPNAMQ
jgi:anhydro-N-acetylmuramic acid kinase